jgi:hypothetical protein
MSDRDPKLAPFDALIGAWTTEATHPKFDGGVVTGRVTYEWLEGGHYLIQRSWNDHELFPDGLCVIGAPEEGDGLLMEYFDSRGVRRTYDVSFEGGVLRIWRMGAGFDQRMTAIVEGDEFVFQAELAETPGEWKDDLRAVYRRA